MGRPRKGVVQRPDGQWTVSLPIAVGSKQTRQFTDRLRDDVFSRATEASAGVGWGLGVSSAPAVRCRGQASRRRRSNAPAMSGTTA
jgi:hypothetical protein